MNTIFRLIYISEIDSDTFNSEILKDILITARRNNNKNGIKGVLIFDYSHFLQVLEGNNASVSETFLKIAKDPRHKGIRLVSAYNANSSGFENWDMEFKELDSIVGQDSTKICDMSIDDIEKLLDKLHHDHG